MRAFIGTLIAGGLALSGVVATAGQAAAATPPTCSASSGRSCVAIEQYDNRIHSVRVDGRCLYFTHSDTYHYYPNVTVPTNGSAQPSVSVYGGDRCQSNTGLDVNISHWARWTDDYNYRHVAVGV
jgi:hypothetical protein